MIKIEQLYNEWEKLQPIDSRKQYLLSQRFTVDYNFNSNHIEGNTLTYGQTELLLLFGKVVGEGELKDYNDMKASQVGMKMMTDQASLKPLLQSHRESNFWGRPHSELPQTADMYPKNEVFRGFPEAPIPTKS